jgi:hypothetical protein
MGTNLATGNATEAIIWEFAVLFSKKFMEPSMQQKRKKKKKKNSISSERNPNGGVVQETTPEPDPIHPSEPIKHESGKRDRVDPQYQEKVPNAATEIPSEPQTPTSQEEKWFFRSMVESLYQELYGEIHDNQDAKYDRIVNFLSVPKQMESFMIFGYLICLDSFLYLFTILPLRIVLTLLALLKRVLFGGARLNTTQKMDLLKGALLIVCSYLIMEVDASRLYHSIRGQTVIKLHVIFGSLEILEKLCAAFGHDVLDSLFATVTLQSSAFRHLSGMIHFGIATLYVCMHTLILFYQCMSLNVAINSYNNVLLTLMLSNQFVEIKGSVFKRFESGNLFQLACADISERFQLSVYLTIITMRNFFEILGDGAAGDVSNYFWGLWYQLGTALHQSPFHQWNPYTVFGTLKSTFHYVAQSNEFNLFQIIFGPALVILGLEVLVDWLKHAFIAKFNGIPPNIYKRYKESLCRDILGIRTGTEIYKEKVLLYDQVTNERSPIVARRIGFVSLPLACLVIRVGIQIASSISIMPGTLVEEPWEDLQQDEDEIGSWKLPNKLIRWIKQSRINYGGKQPSWMMVLMQSVWGYLSIFLMYVELT